MEKKTEKPCKPEAPNAANTGADTLRWQGRGDIRSDVQGSYTGTPEDGGMPVQDADDL